MQGRTAELESGVPLPFVAISYTDADGVARSSASDGDARFSVPARTGSVVRFVAVGRVPVEVTAGGDGTPILVRMRESTTELDPVNVYGDRPVKRSGLLWLLALLGLAAATR